MSQKHVNWTMLLAGSVFLAFILGFYIAGQISGVPEITGFTVSVGGGLNKSALTAFDQSDPEGGNQSTLFNTTIRFFANYTNSSTNLPINDTLGGLCNITFSDSINNNLTFNSSSGLFEYNRTNTTAILQAGIMFFNITCSGPGYEQWNVTDNLTIGCGFVNSNVDMVSNASINGSTCYRINASNLTINCNGFAIEGNRTSGTSGIRALTSIENITIQNCIIKRFQKGFLGEFNSTGLNIRNNHFLDIGPATGADTAAIFVGSFSTADKTVNSTIVNNTIFNMSGSGSNDAAIALNRFHSGNITGNNLTSNGGEASIYLLVNNTFNLIAHNLLRGSIGSSGIKFTGGSSGGSANNTLLNNTILGFSTAISVTASSNGNSFTNNNLVGNSIGFSVTLATDLNLNNNTIANGTTGILFSTPTNATIGNNTFSNLTTIISFEGPPIVIDLTFQNDFGSIEYRNLSINGTVSMSSINISQNLTAVNISANSLLNKSARICVNFSGSCTPTIYVVPSFTTNLSFITSNGTQCTSSSDPSCSILSCSAPTACFNVSHFSSFAIIGASPAPPPPPSAPSTPSTGTYSLGPAPKPPEPKPKQPPSLPKQDGISTSIAPPSVNINSHPCAFVDGKEDAAAITQSEISQSLLKLKEGETVVTPPFKANCASKLDTTLNLPDTYKDLRVIKCDVNRCNDVAGSAAEKLECGTNFYPDISRKTAVLDPKDFPIRLEAKEASNTNVLENNYRIALQSIYTGKIKAAPLTRSINEPLNRFARIAGTPLEILFEGSLPAGKVTVTLPYAVKENVDEDSIGIYIYKDGDWTYVNGRVNKEKKIVSAELQPEQNIVIAPIGVFCFNCLKSQLLQFYNGTTRDAVVLVHGLEIAPGRLQDIMDDIRLTNQPWQGWTFEYLSNRSIDDNAKDFADLLEANSDKYDYIYIAAHSMGGIVAQEALRYAHEQNSKEIKYTFPFKVRKVVAIASPNKGTIKEGIYKDLFDFLMRSEKANELFNFNAQVIRELIQGKTVQKIPGVEYLVIAGTKSYEFLKTDIPNDGIISVESAQFIGGESVNNRCNNFWDIDITHTDILNNKDSRRVIERIVASEIAESLRENALMGYNQYFRIRDDSCSPGSVYVVVGKKITPAQAPVPLDCGCGNGACGIDETEISCPTDCARIEAPRTRLIDLIRTFLPLKTMLIFAALIIGGAILVTYTIKRHNREHSDEELSKLKTQMRMYLDSRQKFEAARTYDNLEKAFKKAPESVKQKHHPEIEAMHAQLNSLE